MEVNDTILFKNIKGTENAYNNKQTAEKDKKNLSLLVSSIKDIEDIFTARIILTF